MTILRGNLETMDVHDPTDVDQVRSLAVDEVDRMDRLVNDLLLLARSRRPDFLRWEPVDVDDLAAEAFARIRVIGEREWRLTDPVGGTVVADRQRLLQAIVQLAANAVKYSAPGDLIELGLQWETGDRGRVLVISLRDTGVGIEEHQLRRIFDRFQQVRESSRGEGLGLGLAIVRAIAVGHGGEVGVRSAFGVGSIFEIRIPAVAGSGNKAQDETSEEDEQVWQRS